MLVIDQVDDEAEGWREQQQQDSVEQNGFKTRENSITLVE